MPIKIKGVKVPHSFRKWLAKRMKKKGFKNPMAFVQWSLYQHWKPATIKRWIRKYKKSK